MIPAHPYWGGRLAIYYGESVHEQAMVAMTVIFAKESSRPLPERKGRHIAS